jgi:hypothetical protein
MSVLSRGEDGILLHALTFHCMRTANFKLHPDRNISDRLFPFCEANPCRGDVIHWSESAVERRSLD